MKKVQRKFNPTIFIKNTKQTIASNKLMTVLGLLIIGVVLVVTAVVWSGSDAQKSKTTLPSTTLTDSCEKSATITYSCYKNQLNSITYSEGPSKAVKLVKTQFEKIPFVKAQCHQLVHVIGRAAYDKYDDLGKTFVEGDHFCASGYFHGASEEIVVKKGPAYFSKNANKVCSVFVDRSRYKEVDHYNCVHGLGHGILEAEDQELFKALSVCDLLSGIWQQQSCYSGVFMQNIMIAQGSDAVAPNKSKYLKPEDPMYPCTAVDNKYMSGCYIIQSSYALSVSSYDFAKVFSLCADVADSYNRIVCYQSVGRDASGGGNNLEETKKRCLIAVSTEAQINCIIGAAKDIVYSFHSDKEAMGFCQSLPEHLLDVCQNNAKSYYSTF
ncbi:hypothetical protein H0X09_01915 [Candidatus Saccharibacteria bacterium]|nr:hypothetical protein [Candidatus Saccharibacteria bacterium]